MSLLVAPHVTNVIPGGTTRYCHSWRHHTLLMPLPVAPHVTDVFPGGTTRY